MHILSQYNTHKNISPVAENQTWKSIYNVAMDFTKARLELYAVVLLSESSYREGKARLFLGLHSKRVRYSVNKLHQGKFQLGEKGKKTKPQ